MKILFFIESLCPGGKERQLVELLKGLSHNNKFSIRLVMFENIIVYPEFYSTKINYEIIPRNSFSTYKYLLKIINEFSPDIIHSWGKTPTLFSILPSILKKIKLVDGSIRYAAKFDTFSKVNLISELNFFFSDQVIANSNAGLISHNKSKKKKYDVIYNGLDISRFSNLELTPDLSILKKELLNFNLVIGVVGSLVDSKDHFTIIRALNDLMLDYRIACLILGEGPNQNKIEQSINTEYKKNYFFLGQRDDVERIIPLFDLGILLSNTKNGRHAEGISNSIMEQMYLKVPVIATDSGGNLEIIDDQVTGYLIPSYDIEKLKHIITLLISDERKRSQMGELASQSIIEKFSLSRMVENHIKMYNKVING